MQITGTPHAKTQKKLGSEILAAGWGLPLTFLFQSVCLFYRQTHLQTSLLTGPSSVLWEWREKQTNRPVGDSSASYSISDFPRFTTGGRGVEWDAESLNSECFTAKASGNCSPEHVKTPPYLFYSGCLVHFCSKSNFDISTRIWNKVVQVWAKFDCTACLSNPQVRLQLTLHKALNQHHSVEVLSVALVVIIKDHMSTQMNPKFERNISPFTSPHKRSIWPSEISCFLSFNFRVVVITVICDSIKIPKPTPASITRGKMHNSKPSWARSNRLQTYSMMNNKEPAPRLLLATIHQCRSSTWWSDKPRSELPSATNKLLFFFL